ncbi:glycosyltransferase family 2 protein [Patescibacteria group bacterium]|nr:glycosyltransferase family 2 protein [Patescibacteria group bacterium]
MDLSVIILSYNNSDMLRKTLQSVLRSVTGYKFEVIVVDNDSPDRSADMVEAEFGRDVRLIRNKNNGFSAGNNVGLKQARGRYILFLNPDTEVDTNVFQECVALMDERKDIGMLGCKLIKGDGKPDHAAKRRFPNPWNSFLYFLHLSRFLPKGQSYDTGNFSADEEGETDSLSGAFMMTRREVVDKVGGWDEDFFMYGEDIEYCYRVKSAGWKVYYYPKVVTIHYKGQSSKRVSNFSLYHFHKAMWIFYKKHYAKNYPFFMNWLVYLGIWARYWMLRARNSMIKDPYVSK